MCQVFFCIAHASLRSTTNNRRTNSFEPFAQPTVAKMLKRLASVGLIEQIPWRGVFLTPEGEKLAQMSRERHQIVENFFLALGISAETARIDAEGVEHHVSEETLEAFRLFSEKRGFTQ